MTFLDTSTLAGRYLKSIRNMLRADALWRNVVIRSANSHVLAETFATLTGFYKVPTDAAAELTLGLKAVVTIEPLLQRDYGTAIAEARQRGVMGGGIYDSLHATFARRKGATRIITRNPSHFAHPTPELEVVVP